MKFIIVVLSLFVSSSTFAQMFIENTESRNSYEIHVFKNNRCIHWHLMKPGDRLKIDATFGDDVYWEFICLTDFCDNLNLTRTENLKKIGAVVKSKQLKSVVPGILNTSRIHPFQIPIYKGWFSGYDGKVFVILPKLYCEIRA